MSLSVMSSMFAVTVITLYVNRVTILVYSLLIYRAAIQQRSKQRAEHLVRPCECTLLPFWLKGAFAASALFCAMLVLLLLFALRDGSEGHKDRGSDGYKDRG